MSAPISEDKKRKLCRFVVLGLSHREAARAAEIAPSTAEKILRQPEYRRIIEKGKAAQEDLAHRAVDVVERGMNALNHDGEPNYLAQFKAAEAVLKHYEAIQMIEGGAIEAEDLEGVIHIMPQRDGTNPEE